MARTSVTQSVKYPQVEVKLLGGDGNALVIIAKVQRALRAAIGVEAEREFVSVAWDCATYRELLRYIQATVRVV